MQTSLIENADEICIHLDAKNAVAFRQHVLIDFQRVVIDGFSQLIDTGSASRSHAVEYMVGGVFYALLSRTAVDSSVEANWSSMLCGAPTKAWQTQLKQN